MDYKARSHSKAVLNVTFSLSIYHWLSEGYMLYTCTLLLIIFFFLFHYLACGQSPLTIFSTAQLEEGKIVDDVPRSDRHRLPFGLVFPLGFWVSNLKRIVNFLTGSHQPRKKWQCVQTFASDFNNPTTFEMQVNVVIFVFQDTIQRSILNVFRWKMNSKLSKCYSCVKSWIFLNMVTVILIAVFAMRAWGAVSLVFLLPCVQFLIS